MDIWVIILLLLVAVGLAAVGVSVRSQARKAPRASARRAPSAPGGGAKETTQSPRNPFRATSIRLGKKPCAAAQALASGRFLVEGDEIPRLPLPECDAAECHCTYAKHRDRRDEFEDRRALGGGNRMSVGESERRSGSERRREDQD